MKPTRKTTRDGQWPRVICVTPNLRTDSGGPTVSIVNGVLAENVHGTNTLLLSTRSHDPEDDRPAFERLRAGGVSMRLFSQTGRSRRGALWGVSLPLLVWMTFNVRGFDVIHLRYIWCLTTLIGCLLARVYRIPVVITPHESLTDFDIEVASGSWSKRLLKRLLRRFILGSADRLILASEVEVMNTDPGRAEVKVVPHPVPLPEPDSLRSSEDPERFRIGFLGRHAEKKGIRRLIEAVALSGHDHWVLNLAGPPSPDHGDRPYRELISALGIEARVEWPGLLVEDRDRFLSDLDVLVMPSDFESFGMVAAEAMACETPVIVPESSGIASLVRESSAGIVVERPLPEDLLAALERLDAEPSTRREMGHRGREAVFRELSFTAFQEATADIYLELTDRRRAEDRPKAKTQT